MAENCGGNISSRKKKLPSMDRLIDQGKNILATGKKRRRLLHYEFSTDPSTGRRNRNNTYNPKYYDRNDINISSSLLQENSDHMFEVPDASFFQPINESDINIPRSTVENMTMSDILVEAKNLLSDWKSVKKTACQQKKQTWHGRQNILNDSWEKIRSSLMEVFLQTKFAVGSVDDFPCENCSDAKAVIRCEDCNSNKYFCGNCDVETHKRRPFHDRNAILNGFHEPISSTLAINSKQEWIAVERSLPPGDVNCPKCLCKTTTLCDNNGTHCIAVTLKGRFDLSHTSYRCPQCENVIYSTDPHVIIQLGFWPGSISDMTYVFHQDLFHYWDSLQKHVPGISQNSFLKSLEVFSTQKGRTGTINSKAFTSSFREWKFCQYELNKLRQINWMECPACEQQQHSVHMDGNMKLYRYRSAGIRQRECYYGEAFIASNEKVQQHLCKIYQNGNDKVIDGSKCGNSIWRAAGNSLKKKKNVDETGLEIAGCRHSLAQHAVSMKHGEVYGYAHYMQIKYYLARSIQFFWYDVICKYWPWLKKNDVTTSQKIKPALSVMHAKAHAWYCQVIWGGRWQTGASATTGEEVEQINSHFSRLGSTTKHMLPEGREELLTEHAFDWNKRKILKLASVLAKRYAKANDKISNLQKELESIVEKLELDRNNMESTLQNWKKDILAAATLDEELRNKRYSISVEEMQYICHLLTLEALTPKQKTLFDMAEKIYKEKSKQFQPKICHNYSVGEDVLKRKALEYLRYDMECHHNTISHLAFNIAKLADSSKQRMKLRKKIGTEKERVQSSFLNYNRVADEPLKDIEEILNGKFPWKCGLQPNDEIRALLHLKHSALRRLVDLIKQSYLFLPLVTKRSAVDKLMEIRRFQEEVEVIEKEMFQYLEYYTKKSLPALYSEHAKWEKLLQDEARNCEQPFRAEESVCVSV